MGERKTNAECYDTRVEKPSRGGAYRFGRAIVRLFAGVVRLAIVVLAVLILVNVFAYALPQDGLATLMGHVWAILPGANSPALAVRIGERGTFYGGLALYAVALVAVDGALDWLYKRLK